MALNDISKKIKHKSDQQWRTMANEQSASTSETSTGEVYVNDPSEYTQTIAQGKNITITTAGNVKTINAVMGLLEGSNISISAPDSDGKVTITGTVAGKGISIADFTGKDGFVLTYNETLQVFELAEAANSYDLPQATETVLGGIKAKAKTTEASEIAIDTTTGKLYGPAPDAAANGLPSGGTTGQILSKIDNTDYNVEWVDPPSGGSAKIIQESRIGMLLPTVPASGLTAREAVWARVVCLVDCEVTSVKFPIFALTGNIRLKIGEVSTLTGNATVSSFIYTGSYMSVATRPTVHDFSGLSINLTKDKIYAFVFESESGTTLQPDASNNQSVLGQGSLLPASSNIGGYSTRAAASTLTAYVSSIVPCIIAYQ